ncbi:MAG: hypothetical protein WC414_00585 [Patescibacteria group bacterium]
MGEDIVLTKLFEMKDDVDKKIMSNTFNIVMCLNLDIFSFKTKKDSEEYFNHIKSVAHSLLKANNHLRKYNLQEKEILEDFKKECLSSSNTIDMSLNPIDLISEIDGMLNQIKAALDSLAKSLNPLLGFSLNGWHKKNKKSGKVVLDSIDNNLSLDLNNKAQNLKKYIENNISWISYIVFLRDSIHRGRLENVSNIIYKQKNQEVISQRIYHNGEEFENVNDFLIRLLNEIIIFLKNIILLSLSIKISSGMCIVENKDNNWPQYSLSILM